jgi:hypothetical protein
MADSYAMYALRKKRARIAGEIEHAERALAKQREKLATLDSVILMFSPDCHPDMIPPIRPYRTGLFFGYQEAGRLVLDALREAGKPVPTRLVVDWILVRKGLAPDALARQDIDKTILHNLHRLVARGWVRQLVSKPESWWELAG